MKKIILLILIFVSYNSFSQQAGFAYVGGGFDPDARAYFNRAGVTDASWKVYANTLISKMKSMGFWAKADAIWITAAPDQTTACTQLKSSSYTLSLVNSPTFTANEGFTGNGSNMYINTTFNISANGVNYLQDDGGYSIYNREAAPTSGKFWCGAFNSGHATYLLKSGGNVVFDCNNNGSDGSVINSSWAGFWTCNRTDASTLKLYYNGSAVPGGTGLTSATPSNNNMYLLAFNNNGTAASHSNIQISFFALHGALDATMSAALNTAVEEFMDALGKGVE